MVILVVACFAAVGVLALILVQHREPHHRGRPVHEWLEALGYSPQQGMGDVLAQADAEAAVKQIGTDAIPLMLQWIAHEPKPSKIKHLVSTLLSKLPLGQNFISVQRWLVSKDPWDRHADLAMAAFGILGPAAFPAVPGLARVATSSTDSEPAHRAVDALVKIGPLALPALISVSTNRNAKARFYAMRSISNLGTNAAPAVPIIIHYLTDKAVAGAAFETLGRLKLEPQLLVPSLMVSAHDPDAVLRSWAILTLGDFGQEARRAAPVLLSALSDNEAVVRESATNALQSIAPELLTQTPPR